MFSPVIRLMIRQASRLVGGVTQAIDAQRDRRFLWAPLWFGCGIGIYFWLPQEPTAALLLGGMSICLCLLGLLRVVPDPARVVIWGLWLCLAGFCLAGARAATVAHPVLGFRYYGPVQGRVIQIDRSASQALRLTLDQVVLQDMDPERTPKRLRVALHDQPAPPFDLSPVPGMTVLTTAMLSPPPGPAEPGGFDFQRMAWFDGLGAVGYSRVPVLRLDRPQRRCALWLARMRHHLSQAIQDQIRGQPGAFAAAILTGDRSGISEDTQEALRRSNLSHLLAISGLHMGLLTGAVFFALRLGLAVSPWLALHWPIKKIAALAALLVGTLYLALSGWNVATERAYVMIAVMFGAVLLDRRAVSLHSVAVAALIVLTLQPEVLPEPGFQMSFSATTALVVVFGRLRGISWSRRLPGPLRALFAMTLASAVAGLATAPFAAAHFNRVANFGLIANFLAVPAMGSLVMPAALLAMLMWPLGLSEPAFAVVALGLRWVLWVAQTVSSWEGALSGLATPDPWVVPVLSLGALFGILWRGAARLLGPGVMILALWGWSQSERPVLLIADSGAFWGQLGPEGRVLSRAQGHGFAASVWLENDGDLAAQDEAAVRGGGTAEVLGVRAAFVSGRDWQDKTRRACRDHDLVVLNQLWQESPPEGCLLADLRLLRASGALAVAPCDEGICLSTSLQRAGVRLWNAPALRRHQGRGIAVIRRRDLTAAHIALPPGALGGRLIPGSILPEAAGRDGGGKAAVRRGQP